MFETALFDCVINEKCCNIDRGQAIWPLFFGPTPRNLPSKVKKKMLMPEGQAGRRGGGQLFCRGRGLGAAGIDWCITLTFAIKTRTKIDFPWISVIYLTIIPWARMGSESIAHEAEGRMGYWLRGHEGERNDCFYSKIQLVGQKYWDKTTSAS